MVSIEGCPGDVCLFCFAHPDDEFFCCATLKRLVEHGCEVFCAWGVATPQREEESRAVMALLGVPSLRLRFAYFPDGGVVDTLSEYVVFWEHILKDIRPERVFVPAFECGHLDHDATNFAVVHAVQRLRVCPLLIEFPLYHPYSSRVPTVGRFAYEGGEITVELTRGERALKKKVLSYYRSQRLPWLLKMYGLLVKMGLKPPGLWERERFRPLRHPRYDSPPLPAPLARGVERSPKWQRFAQAVSALCSSSPLGDDDPIHPIQEDEPGIG
ncbi:MAG: PIG-L family deacetylase [Fimbriimonadales bacterium]|nr:PIG-L family deacetylase [Fimbriimonadales bacterium]